MTIEIEKKKLLDAIVDREAVARLKRQTLAKLKYNPGSERAQALRLKRKLGLLTK